MKKATRIMFHTLFAITGELFSISVFDLRYYEFLRERKREREREICE